MRGIIDSSHIQEQNDDGGLVEDEDGGLVEEEDDYELDLSLCDFPLFGEEQEGSSGGASTASHRTSGSELFEFFSDLNYEMPSAEEIILCGRLVPFREPPLLSSPSPPPPVSRPFPIETSLARGSVSELRSNRSVFHRTRSAPGSNPFRPPMIRTSRSLNYGELDSSRLCHNCSHEEVSSSRTSSTKSTTVFPGDAKSHAAGKPTWSSLTFGASAWSGNHYGQMELKDIRNRQSRLNRPASFSFGELPGIRQRGGKRYSCSILGILSCKNHCSVDVKASLCPPPPCEPDPSGSHVLCTS